MCTVRMEVLMAGSALSPITGIDVSAYQPKIDWAAVAKAGHRFAFIKSSEGNGWVSKFFKAQWAGAKVAGLLRGAYHFARWETAGSPVDDALDEAAHFYETVGDLGPGDLPPVLDLEWITGKKRDADELALWALTFLQETERLFGRKPIIYTGPSFWRYCLLPDKKNLSLELTQYILWEVDYNGPLNPMNGAETWKWTFWQWTGSGACPGITGKCDLNRFNGTEADLLALAEVVS